MDLHTVVEVVSPAGPGQWRPGDAWLAGGTALFSEPRPEVTRLLDLATAGWTPISVGAGGMEIAATCTVADLAAFQGAPGFTAFHGLATACCHAFLASFKIWNVATVGGNLCAALPAGPMIALTAALDGECLILGPAGERRVPVAGFVTGDGTTVLRDGELLRSITLPARSLTGRTAHRQGSLFRHGRSAVLLAGRVTQAGSAAPPHPGASPDRTGHTAADTRDGNGSAAAATTTGWPAGTGPGAGGDNLVLTVTAATVRPYQLRFDGIPDQGTLRTALEAAIPDDAWTDDVHGLPEWRRHLTFRYAEEIRRELAA
ncbi:FAD binding domain-containing protein [Actinoplanes sp. RD1]|uniref:FAD binding domain-containing protein n=1 Tax=Actinoplanes sp. RD1 TaxID=3064538 RepID=UPI0027414391|nr:FAD binding domain-containing protein [Actinoplanes sp. RD1]